jgi:hypothetical protein
MRTVVIMMGILVSSLTSGTPGGANSAADVAA